MPPFPVDAAPSPADQRAPFPIAGAQKMKDCGEAIVGETEAAERGKQGFKRTQRVEPRVVLSTNEATISVWVHASESAQLYK
ncbi:hypothetical protein CR513_27878, partial [Mucuna pruriens]